MMQEFPQSVCLLELEKFSEHLRNYSCTSATCLYILKYFLIGHICFSVKKVRISSAEGAAKYSTDNSVFCWNRCSTIHTFQNEKMEAPSIIMSPEAK